MLLAAFRLNSEPCLTGTSWHSFSWEPSMKQINNLIFTHIHTHTSTYTHTHTQRYHLSCVCVRLITVCVCMCVCVCVRLISVCGEALVAPGATLAPLIASMNPKEAGPSGRPPTPGPTQHTRVNELREKFMNELKHIPREYTHIHTHSHGHNTHTIAHTHTHTHTHKQGLLVEDTHNKAHQQLVINSRCCR